MLVASIVGVDMRATMDIDTTVKALPLNEADVQRIIEEICNIPLEDNVGKTYNRKKEKQRIGVEFRNGFDADFLRSLVLLIHFRTSERSE